VSHPRELLYTLDGHEPVECPDVIEWARWFGTTDRHVAVDHLTSYEVSTVFLGVNYCWWPKGTPILFETMVFSVVGTIEDMQRYATWDDAEAGHKRIVSELRKREADERQTANRPSIWTRE
jgi:hypothetical protein